MEKKTLNLFLETIDMMQKPQINTILTPVHHDLMKAERH